MDYKYKLLRTMIKHAKTLLDYPHELQTLLDTIETYVVETTKNADTMKTRYIYDVYEILCQNRITAKLPITLLLAKRFLADITEQKTNEPHAEALSIAWCTTGHKRSRSRSRSRSIY